MRRSAYSLRLLLICSMMSALSIILGKYLAFNIGSFIRISGENLPILFTGLAFGPWAGLTVGVVADLVGCLLVGYEINPIITLGAGAVGVISGGLGVICRRYKAPLRISLSVTVAHLIGSVLIKSLGLAIYYGMPFGVTAGWRCLNYLAVGAAEVFILAILLSNPAIKARIKDASDKHRE